MEITLPEKICQKVDGCNTLRRTGKLMAITNFRGFSAYDPDQITSAGVGLSSGNPNTNSNNFLGTASGYRYAQASFTGLNAVLASNNVNVKIGFSNDTNFEGNCLNTILASAGTAACVTALNNGAAVGGQDRAFGYGFNIANFTQGSTQSFTVYQLFGDGTFNLNTALAALPGGSGSSSSSSGVPEPGTGSLFLMGSASAALGLVAGRGRRHDLHPGGGL